LTIFILLLATGLIVLLGIQAKNVWVGVLALVGLVACLFSLGTARSHQYGGYWIGLVVGLAALTAAVWLSQMAGRFWWTPLFLFISLMFFSNGLSLASEYEQPAGTTSVIVGVLLFLFSVLGPWLLYGPISGGKQAAALPTVAPTISAPIAAPTAVAQATKAPTAAPAPTEAPVSPPVERGNFFAGLWDFLIGSIKSGWGIFYLAVVILLGRIWLGKWGWLIAPALLLLAAGGLAWIKPGGAEGLTSFFTTRPLEHVAALLGWSEKQLGSAAWGALIAGGGLVALLLPAYIAMYSANRAMVRAQRVRQVFGTTIAADLLRRSNAYSPYTSLVTLVSVAASVYGFILLWKALTVYAAVSGAPAFPLLGIADLSLPRWKPVMQWPYFLNAGIYALVSLILTAIQRRMGLALFSVNWALILVGAAILGFFVPAGTILFLLGQSLALGFTAPLSLLKKTRLAAPTPRPAPPVQADQFLEELRRQIVDQERELGISEEEIGYQPPPSTPVPHEEPPIIIGGKYLDEKPAVAGDLLLEHPCEIVELIISSQDNRPVFLDVYGDLWEITQAGDEEELAGFSMENPLGLASVSGGRLAAVDQSGKIHFSSGAPEEISTAEKVFAFAINSFGTILAYISPDSTCLRGLILAAGKDQMFIDCGERLTDICFSADNRYLGLGTAGSGILIFDMARRQIDQRLKSERHLHVSHICPGPDGGWLAAYENNEVALWSSEGKLVSEVEDQDRISCLAFDPRSGNAAFGNVQGQVTVLDPDFDILLQAHLHEEDITSIAFEPGGGCLLTAGVDGAIRKVSF
jgi:hypothetical protein